MANKVVIDIEARFIDSVSPNVKHLTKDVDALDKSATELGKKKPKIDVQAETSTVNRKLDELDAKTNRLQRSKVSIVLDAMDKASGKIQSVLSAGRSLAGRTWQAVLKVKDLALSPLTKIKNMLFNIKTLIGAIVGALAANKFILQPIGVADQYSSAKIGFQTLLGQERGQKMMDDLDKFAKQTPFNTSGVIAASQRMIAMGWNAENIIDDMRTIGDAAAATGKGTEGLDRIVLALSQIRSKGKLSTEELNQLAETGISAKRYLAEGLGYGSGDNGIMALSKDLENGAIGSEAAINAILQGMKEYDGMMNKTANETVSGLKSQIDDAFEINIIRRWGQGLQAGAKKGLGSVLNLLDKSEDGLARIGDMLYDIGKAASEWAAAKLERVVKMATALTETEAWKKAGIGGKIKILWDGLVADPIREWWEGGGQEKTATTVNKIGGWIGKNLSKVLLGVLGATDYLDDGQGFKTGTGIADAFVRGFLDNFDGDAITNAFGDAIKNVWTVLPGWAQFMITGYGTFKGLGAVASLIEGVSTVAGLSKGLIGATGNSMVAGSGLLGGLANVGYGLTGGAASAAGYFGIAGGMSGAAAALAGAGGIAGGIAGGASVISGITDLINASKNKNLTEDQKIAYKQSAGLKLGGAGIGAAFGTAILPGLGTLIGAGIGGGLGWLAGKQTKKEAAEAIASMEELEKQAETSTEAANELVRRQELIAQSIKQHFGDVTLSMEEIEAVAQNIAFGDKANEISEYTTAAKSARSAVQALEAATADLSKWNWRGTIGFKFDDADKEQYLASVQNYIYSAEQTVEAQHYTFTAAVNMLLEPDESRKSILSSTDTFFAGLQKQLGKLGKELTTKIQVALEDGEIDPESEAKVIADLQAQIAEITSKVAKAQSEAKLESLKIKFGSGTLDEESFRLLQQQLADQIEQSTSQYDTALEASITTLKLELNEGAIDQGTYDDQIKALTEGYTANVGEIKANAEKVQFEILGDAYENVLGEDAAAKLQSALEKSITDGVKPVDWTQEQAANYLGIPSLSEKSGLAIGSMLTSIAETLPNTAEAAAVGDSIAQGITPSEDSMSALASNTHNLATNLLTGEFAKGTEVSMPLVVNVSPTFKGLPTSVPIPNQARGGLWGADHIPGFASGGIAQGGAQIIRVAEEGDPEMIIPLGSQRRDRGLKLWEKAGEMLGVPGFATGGLVGGKDEGLRFTSYGASEGSGQAVQVEVGGITVEFNVTAGEGSDVVETIKEKANEIAETVAGVMYNSFRAQFENTPVKGAL